MVTVITSIPPNPPKREIDGNIFDTSYRNVCVDSWQKLGGGVISVNSHKEYEAIKSALPDVKVFAVDSDATAVAGKPLVLFDDLIQIALATDSEIFLFTNSDIFLSDVSQITKIIQKMRAREVVVARRVNVTSLNAALGSTFRWGYDLFIVRRDDLDKLCTNRSLYFGEPWWDIHAFCSLVLNDVDIFYLNGSHALHLLHKDAYSLERWTEIGQSTLAELSARVDDRDIDTRKITSKKLARTIKRFERKVHLCSKPSYIHYIRIIKGRSPFEAYKHTLHKFCKEVKLFSEQVIGFGESSPERISLTCTELRYALFDTDSDRMISLSSVNKFLDLIDPKITEHSLVRFGGDADGGYLVPNDLEDLGACFSPGVSDIANFELDMAERKIKCFLADYSVFSPPVKNKYFLFEKKFLGRENSDTHMRLEDWINRSCYNGQNDLILQMDIEGAEYEVILDTPTDTIDKFRIMVIEFHNLNSLLSNLGNKIIYETFLKLLKNFSIVHIHPNNSVWPFEFKGIQVPPIMEFTFLRNDRITRSESNTAFPHPLDRPNVPAMEDFALPSCWFSRQKK